MRVTIRGVLSVFAVVAVIAVLSLIAARMTSVPVHPGVPDQWEHPRSLEDVITSGDQLLLKNAEGASAALVNPEYVSPERATPPNVSLFGTIHALRSPPVPLTNSQVHRLK